MRAIAISLFMVVAAGCSSAPPPPPAAPSPPPPPEAPSVSRDPGLYKTDYQWPADWADAVDEAGKSIHGGKLARTAGDRRIVVVDSASSLFGHDGQLSHSVIAFGSHCGMNVAETVVKVKPLGVIGNDAGIGLHAAGIICISMGDANGIPAATVSADTAYMGVALSLWTTGKISVVNKTAEALGVKVGMTTQEAAEIMATKATPKP